MKLKNTNKIALRALAVTAALATAQAALITVSSNYTQDTVSNNIANNGANTVQANAGGSTLTFGTGASLTANGAPAALNIAAAGYTLNNSGTLDGATAGATAGVTVGAQAILHNLATGTIRSANGQGIIITAGTGSTITNDHLIEGSDDGIRTATNNLTVTNNAGGTIRGITGGGSDGIQAAGSLTLVNFGSIAGNAIGVNATTTASIINHAGVSITGTSAGVSVSTGLILINDGTISGTAAAGNGVLATTGASIANNVGATISGGNDGVQVATGAAIINAGTIQGLAGDGVQLTDGNVTNANTGSIVGGDQGIRFAGTGVVTNSGSITGATVGINFGGAATLDTLNMNGGTLTGGTLAVPTTALDGGTGTDTLNFNAGAATITGSVLRMENINRNTATAGVASITGTTISADFVTLAVGNVGSLYLYGAVTPSAGSTAIVVNSGVLGGSGTWTSNLTFNGGSLLVHVNPSTLVSDLISVSGNVNITAAAGVVLAPSTQDAPLQNTSGATNLRVLDVGGTRTNQFSTPATIFFEAGHTDAGPLVATAGSGAFTSSTVSLNVVSGNPLLLVPQDADDTYVQVVHHYQTVAGLGSFGQQFGTFLNGRVTASLTNPVLADFLGFLDYSDAATVANVMNAYDPSSFQASIAAAVAGSREIHRIVEQQNAGDRLFPTNNHVWGNFNYDSISGNGNSYRATFGAGWAIDTVHLGALVSYAETDINDYTQNESWSYGMYFASGAPTGWQLNGYIGGTNNSITGNQSTIVSPLVDSVVHFNPDGNGFQALLSGAYMMEQGVCNWGPTFGVEYVSADMDGTIQPGANLPSMNYTADKLESLRSLLGLRADFNLSTSFRPYVSAQWAHEFQGESDGYTASFQGGSLAVASPFALGKDSIILRAGLMVGFGESVFGDIGFLGEYSIDGDGADYSGVNLGLRASF